MKKLLFLLCFIATIVPAFGQQSGVRYNFVPEDAGPYQLPNRAIVAKTYSSTISIHTTHEETIIQAAQLTGSPTINSVITDCYKGDKLWVQFSADGSNRTVTFNTGFAANGTLVVSASSTAVVNFMFNGTSWLEISRQNASSPTVTTLTASTVLTNTVSVNTGTDLFINSTIVENFTATTYTATGTYTVTAAQLAGGLLVAATQTATTTMVLPTTALLATQLGATAGTSFEFEVINSGATNGTVTVAVSTGMTASGFPGTNTLTLAGSATVGISRFRILFISASASTLARIN